MKCKNCGEDLWTMELSKTMTFGPMCMNLKCEGNEG